jgi:cholesterol oxidase
VPEMHTVDRVPLADDWNLRAPDGYDVVIIGSGYGGAVTAARLATATWNGPAPTICILERGREWLPGDFPDNLAAGAHAIRSPTNPLGLHEIRFGLDIAVWQASGLGGTSLINANVAIEPDPEVFDATPWPQSIRQMRDSGELHARFDRIRRTLSAKPHPLGRELSKVEALERGKPGAAEGDFDLADIAVNFEVDGINQWGVRQRPCINGGDCITGCNVGAKNTLDTNYLAIAKSRGAHVFPQVEVERIAKNDGGGYLVYCIRREIQPASSSGSTIAAKRAVVLCAGSPGSAVILLRSRERGLELPNTLGSRFSGNGDFFGVAYNSDNRTDALGWGAYPTSGRAQRVQPGPGPTRHPGPTIVARIKWNIHQPLDRRITLEDVSFPLTYVDAARSTFAVLIGRDTDPFDFFDNLRESDRRRRDLFALDPELEKGALNHTLMYLVMGQDDSGGRIELDDATGQARIRWPGVGNQDMFQQASSLMLEHARKLGATYIENPVWAFAPMRTLITVHPLGGCPIGETHSTGVVNEDGQVYDEQGNVHVGLCVADASIMPTALGVNPFLTISALTERIADRLVERLGGIPAG